MTYEKGLEPCDLREGSGALRLTRRVWSPVTYEKGLEPCDLREGSGALQQHVQLSDAVPSLRPLLAGAHGHQLRQVLGRGGEGRGGEGRGGEVRGGEGMYTHLR